MVYDIRSGSLQSLTADLQLATPVLDFKPVSGGSVIFGDGQGSGAITVEVADDNIPEVDEVFVVQLKRVELIQPQSSTFLPTLGEFICPGNSVIERDRQTETDRQRQTDRDTQTETDRDTQTETDRQRQTDRQMDRDRQTDRQTE